jgi:hypothetical protein
MLLGLEYSLPTANIACSKRAFDLTRHGLDFLGVSIRFASGIEPRLTDCGGRSASASSLASKSRMTVGRFHPSFRKPPRTTAPEFLPLFEEFLLDLSVFERSQSVEVANQG